MLILKCMILFSFGFLFSGLFDYIQTSNNLTNWPTQTTHPVWVYASSGFGACLIGLLYPLVDQKLKLNINTNWSKCLRSLGAFIGTL
ncbi:hypothetical protein BC833DRAFT_596820 [Globomyces pollinis-pini]|nr:hypothetical protein BC833DRAFT_596820 [Globomyces pollinis-pini]